MTQVPPILCYHQVVQWPLFGRQPLKPGLIVPLRRFRWQVALLRALGLHGDFHLGSGSKGCKGQDLSPKSPSFSRSTTVTTAFHESRSTGIAAGRIGSHRLCGGGGCCRTRRPETEPIPFWIGVGFAVLIDNGLRDRLPLIAHCRLCEYSGPGTSNRKLSRPAKSSKHELGVEIATFVTPTRHRWQGHQLHCVRDQGYLAAVGIDGSLALPNFFALPRIWLGYAQNMTQFLHQLSTSATILVRIEPGVSSS